VLAVLTDVVATFCGKMTATIRALQDTRPHTPVLVHAAQAARDFSADGLVGIRKYY
jgi:hypothetical protein